DDDSGSGLPHTPRRDTTAPRRSPPNTFQAGLPVVIPALFPSPIPTIDRSLFNTPSAAAPRHPRGPALVGLQPTPILLSHHRAPPHSLNCALYDVLSIPFPPPSFEDAPPSASSTRPPTHYDLSMDSKNRLDKIVFAPDLVRQFVPTTQTMLEAIELNAAENPAHLEFLHGVHP
ncbi:hypothetical protein ABKN59_008543, partial [Abortiporus biennis]